jgi:cell division septation protein DedD
MAQPDACPACGAPAEPGQEYCLQCGARLVPARQLGELGHAWQRRLGRYPGDWVFASLLLLLVAAGSATAGIVAGRDTETASGAQRTIVATSPVVAAPPSPPAQTEPPTTTTAKPRPKPKPATKPSKPGLAVWPATDGFTVVVASIPARGGGLSEATSKAREARSRGLKAGVLESGKFASLHPGYYVVFAGIYGSLEEAERAARADASKYPNAYAREIAH